jgi:hypothetical protein
MVRTLNVTLDDDDFAQIESVKEELGLTWKEFMIEATEALEERSEIDS